MEENHMGWTLLKGVRTDVVNLLKSFASTNSVRYEDFSQVWRQMNFSLIYRYRFTFIELLEFTEELFIIVKEYLMAVYMFPTRVAAFYTLYGLYFKQPIRNAAKIRFTKSQWEEFISFIDFCKAEKHYDIVFIHLKLYINGAYTFTSTIRTVGLERGFRKYFEKKNTILPNGYDVDLLYRPLISENLINSLVKLESLYCKKKSELLGNKNLVFIDGTFAKSLQEELKNYACKEEKVTSKESMIRQNIDQLHKVGENEEADDSDGEDKSQKDKSLLPIRDSEEGSKAIEEKSSKQKRMGNKYLELVAKKKAKLYIKKLREECDQQTGSTSNHFHLPELDFL